MKKITIIGSTGSIGRQTLDVVRKNPDKFCVKGLVAHSDFEQILAQAKEFNVEFVGLTDKTSNEKLSLAEYSGEILNCSTALTDAVTDDVDIVVVACSGINGLLPTVKALSLNIDVALANKETLVVGGEIVKSALQKSTAHLFPVDSEHSAIWQSINSNSKKDLSRIIITASGGAFRNLSIDELRTVTAKEALKHPNWNMGKKITIDCATLMNKGLEIIEGAFLFDVAPSKIVPVIHPQSIIHSMVEYNDGAILAQLGSPSMLVPISYALSYPERLETGVKKVDFIQLGSLTFSEPDRERFPCLKIAEEVADKNGIIRTVMNASNDIAVEAFLNDKIGFMQIPDIIKEQIDSFSENFGDTLEDILACDKLIREKTIKTIQR